LSVSGRIRSFWHDIPLFHEDTVRYVQEIPLDHTAKLEVSTDLPGNPIVHDTDDHGKHRHFHQGIPFNYGSIPQTFENPDKLDSRTGLRGDGDPLDVVELSGHPMPVGTVTSVRVLGILALIDQGETDYKVIAIRSDLQTPIIQLDLIKHWFKYYKTHQGKPPNEFAFQGNMLSHTHAMDIIAETHQEWKKHFHIE
jgi:inorganic pyrophosphatase